MFLFPSEYTGHHVTLWFMARYNNHVKKTTVDFPGGIPLCQFNFQVPQVLLSSNERLTGASDPQRRGMFHHFLCTMRR